ncbi:MAG: HAMP domain-containing histidine kinase, partial [Clostridiales bacterium]|nr:HAMP domain-containing histidine kinase [Clostridiales bacterium]
MKNKKKPDYSALRLKVFSKVALLGLVAAIGTITLRELVRGRMGNLIFNFFMSAFGMTMEQAQRAYWDYILDNLHYIIYGSAMVTFILISYFLMSQFAKYFNEISGGLDMLVEDKKDKISLSPEMATMEHKLNTIKATLEKREKDAKQAEERKNKLVAYLAHDIKTPLTSVLGYLSLINESEGMASSQKEEYVRIALDKAGRLERLIEEFFEITRYNLQSIVLDKESIDLYYMLLQMADEFYPLLSAKGMQIELFAPEDLTVFGDADKLARVFNNILRNAVLYSPDNSKIEISSGTKGNVVSISFKNVGSVPKEELGSIFDKFYRLDTARST